MPDIYMHLRLAEEVKKTFNKEIKSYPYYLGAQGPDPLYYNIFSKTHQTERHIADRLHDTDTQAMFIFMLNYTKKHYSESLYAYLIGFICHYALDVKVHPYVYNNVGIYDETNKETDIYRGLHLKFERAMDAALIQKEQNIAPARFNFTKRYITKNIVPPGVSNLYKDLILEKFNNPNGDIYFKHAVKKMVKNMKYFIPDRFGIKKLLYKFIDLFHQQDMFIQDISFFNHGLNVDVLNTQKAQWYNPTTNTPHTESVLELFNQAKSFALTLIQETDRFLTNTDTVKLEDVFTNLSFNSGVKCNTLNKMQYFNIFTKK
ncbi:MAG: zinc dependent phospholipase C family protein [Candidatus Izimaplasma sp.]|nr:zinc dependent phospholipase C family protein [Candidatus Izimaplasma bacterium]